MTRCLLVLACVVVLTVAAAPAAGAVTASDPDDVDATLDVRSVSVTPLSNGKAFVTFNFWNAVPAWLLHGHPVHLDWGTEEGVPDSVYINTALFRNRADKLRILWGESGSACCFSKPAQRINATSFRATVPNFFAAMPPAQLIRGWSARKIRCRHRGCFLFEGKKLDKTRWVHE